MASLVALLRVCMDSFKTILTSQEFGTEYELLCTELSVQWLRIRLWGQSVGLHIDDALHIQSSLAAQPDIESTVTRCVNTIAFVLTEIEAIRTKYEFRPPLIPDLPNTKTIQSSKSFGTLSDIRPCISLRQQIRGNQKQKSFLSIAKWAICDAKKFDTNVKALRSLIDGLEDISKAAGIINLPPAYPGSTRLSTDNPPPYSFDEQLDRPETPPPEINSAIPHAISVILEDPQLLEHFSALKRYAVATPAEVPRVTATRALAKLATLSDKQMRELRIDVYDDLYRRQHQGMSPLWLPPNPSYHMRRNQARQKLSTLPSHRFKDLVMDVTSELERRFPFLTQQIGHILDEASQMPNSWPANEYQIARRYGKLLPGSPPPFLQYRAPHPESAPLLQHVTRVPPPSWPQLISRLSQSTTTIDNIVEATPAESRPISTPAINESTTSLPITTNVSTSTQTDSSTQTLAQTGTSHEIFKSFRVGMDDPTYKVLPAALRKYNITAPWQTYTLYIMYGDKERCLGMDEKPLVLFKQLDKMGLKPMFMLRKVTPSDGVPLASNRDGNADPPAGVM